MDADTQIKANIKMGTTALHISILLTLTLSIFETTYLQFFSVSTVLSRAYTVQFFSFGVQDIFVSFMLWFMMDEGNKPLYM